MHVSVDNLFLHPLLSGLSQSPPECLQSGANFDGFIRVQEEILHCIVRKSCQWRLDLLFNHLALSELLLLKLVLLLLNKLLLALASVLTEPALKLLLKRGNFFIKRIVTSRLDASH